MNIQEATKSGKPFRRRGWGDSYIYVVWQPNDTVLTLESSPNISIQLEVQDLLADDWYTCEPSDLIFHPSTTSTP